MSFGILGRVVFPVGVLHDHEVAGAMLEPLAECRALAHVARLVENADVVVLLFELLEDARRAVGGEVIDEDEFLGNLDGLHAADELPEPALLVVDGDDDRQLEPWRDRVDADAATGCLAEELVEDFDAAVGIGGDSLHRFGQFIGSAVSLFGPVHLSRLLGQRIRHRSRSPDGRMGRIGRSKL